MVDLTPNARDLHTRYTPPDVLYSIGNGRWAPPDMLIPGDGLPAFTTRMQMQNLLTQLGQPFPVGAFVSDPRARVAPHDTQEFTPEDAMRYRTAGFQLVELPDGELRILDRRALKTYKPQEGLRLSQRLRMVSLEKAGDWQQKLLRHHYLTRHKAHAASVGGRVGLDVSEFHAEHHHSGKADHDHRGGVLGAGLRRSLRR